MRFPYWLLLANQLALYAAAAVLALYVCGRLCSL